MTVIWRADARKNGERSHLRGTPEIKAWLRAHDIDPADTYAAEVLADGDGQVIAYQHARDAQGRLCVVGDRIVDRAPVVASLRSLPPEFGA